MPQSGKYDQAKEQSWRNIISAWRQSGRLKSHFCRDHDIKLNQFCSWETKIRERDAIRKAAAQGSATASGSAGRRKSTERSANGRGQRAPKAAPVDEDFNDFVEVNLKDVPEHAPAERGDAGVIEVSLPNGVQFKLPTRVPVHTLQAIISAVTK